MFIFMCMYGRETQNPNLISCNCDCRHLRSSVTFLFFPFCFWFSPSISIALFIIRTTHQHHHTTTTTLKYYENIVNNFVFALSLKGYFRCCFNFILLGLLNVTLNSAHCVFVNVRCFSLRSQLSICCNLEERERTGGRRY